MISSPLIFLKFFQTDFKEVCELILETFSPWRGFGLFDGEFTFGLGFLKT